MSTAIASVKQRYTFEVLLPGRTETVVAHVEACDVNDAHDAIQARYPRGMMFRPVSPRDGIFAAVEEVQGGQA